MRLAFCFTGQPRDVKNTLDGIKSSWCDNQDVDFFFHSWYGKEGVPFKNDVPSDVYRDDLFDYVINKINPVNYLIEQPKEFKTYPDSPHWPCGHPKFNPNPTYSSQCQFYSNMKCIELKSEHEKKNNFEYDAVIRCRFDYIFFDKYDISKYDMNYLHVKNDCSHTEYALNDMIALSNTPNMNIYGDLFNHLDKYFNMGIEFNPEVILGYHIMYNNVKVAKTLGDKTSGEISTHPERLANRFI